MPINTKEIAAIVDTGGGRVPEGRHVVTCTKGVEDATNAKGDIWELEYQTATGGAVKDKLRWYGGAMGRSRKAVEAFFPAYQSQENVGAADLIAKRAAIDVVHREFQSDRDGKTHVVAEVEFGYHALTGAEAEQQAAASQAAKATVRPLFGGAAAPAAG